MKTCILIPGNPAVASYYLDWIEEIKGTSPLLDVVYASSHVLFDKKLNYVEYDQAFRNYYENILLGLKPTQKVTIIAHSVGGYFALRMLEKLPDRVEKIIIMFPYIGYSTIASLRYIYLPYIIDRFFPLVEFISKFKNILMRRDKYVQEISSEELRANLRFGVKQCEYFNRTKFNVESVLKSINKINFIYTDNDRWCPSAAIELLQSVSHHQRVDLPHDFITNKEARLRMIEKIGLD